MGEGSGRAAAVADLWSAEKALRRAARALRDEHREGVTIELGRIANRLDELAKVLTHG